MTREETFEKVNAIFRDVFDDETINVSDETTADNIEGWDSLMHITLIAEIEEAFDIHFEMQDVTNMESVGEIVNKVMELLR